MEAGIVFVNKSNYLCWPLEILGIPSDINVSSISTSCDCATASMVDYVKRGDEIAKAVLLSFTNSEKVDADFQEPPKLLGIIVTVSSTDGKRYQFTVNVLHTIGLTEIGVT